MTFHIGFDLRLSSCYFCITPRCQIIFRWGGDVSLANRFPPIRRPDRRVARVNDANERFGSMAAAACVSFLSSSPTDATRRDVPPGPRWRPTLAIRRRTQSSRGSLGKFYEPVLDVRLNASLSLKKKRREKRSRGCFETETLRQTGRKRQKGETARRVRDGARAFHTAGGNKRRAREK